MDWTAFGDQFWWLSQEGHPIATLEGIVGEGIAPARRRHIGNA
jgi:hypothetical protein